MNSDNFDIVSEVLRIMQNSSKLENTIIHLIDLFENALNDEQKNEILKEFIQYQKKKSSINEKKDIIFEREKYRNAVESFLMNTAS